MSLPLLDTLKEKNLIKDSDWAATRYVSEDISKIEEEMIASDDWMSRILVGAVTSFNKVVFDCADIEGSGFQTRHS